MKKSILTLAAALLVGFATAEERPADYNTLPANAKALIAKHFAKTTVASATVDKDFMEVEYTVLLADGTSVEFNKAGNWTQVENKSSGITSTIIPKKIASYVSTNYAGAKITKIDIDRTDYEVELSNDIDLKFDLKGTFLRADD